MVSEKSHSCSISSLWAMLRHAEGSPEERRFAVDLFEFRMNLRLEVTPLNTLSGQAISLDLMSFGRLGVGLFCHRGIDLAAPLSARSDTGFIFQRQAHGPSVTPDIILTTPPSDLMLQSGNLSFFPAIHPSSELRLPTHAGSIAIQ